MGVQTRDGIHAFGLVMIDKCIGQHQGADLESTIKGTALGQMVQHIGAEPANRAFLNGDQHVMAGHQLVNQAGIERFGKACIGNSRRKAEAGELLGGFERFGQARAER